MRFCTLLTLLFSPSNILYLHQVWRIKYCPTMNLYSPPPVVTKIYLFCDFVQCSTVHIPPYTPVSFADEYREWGPFWDWWFSHICIDHLFKVFLFFPCKTKWFASEVLFNRLGITCINTMFNCSKVAYIILISRKHLWIIDQHCFEFLLFW